MSKRFKFIVIFVAQLIVFFSVLNDVRAEPTALNVIALISGLFCVGYLIFVGVVKLDETEQ